MTSIDSPIGANEMLARKLLARATVSTAAEACVVSVFRAMYGHSMTAERISRISAAMHDGHIDLTDALDSLVDQLILRRRGPLFELNI